jgi:hypothetical protein
MSWLKKKPIRKRLFEIVRRICLRHYDEEVFICVRKRYQPHLEKYLDGITNANIAHYGGLRGANAFVKANVAVLIGAPFPNPDVLAVKSKVMGVNDRDIFQMECNEEMLQTAHRIRPLLKDETWVYFLSNVDTGYKCTDFNSLPITKYEKMVESKV